LFASLLANFAIIGFFVSIWANSQEWALLHTRRRRSVMLGLYMGAAAVAAMLFSVNLYSGVLFDLRNVAVSYSAVFGGPVAGVISGAIAAAYRIHLGGSGVWSGVIGICAAVLVGCVGHYAMKRRSNGALTPVMLVSALAGLSPVAAMLALPDAVRNDALLGAGPSMALLSLSALAIASFITLRRIALARSRALLLGAIKQAPDYLYVKDPDGRFVSANQNCAAANGFASSEDMVGKSDFDLTDKLRAAGLHREEQNILSGLGAVSEKLEELKGPDGEDKYFVTSKSPVVLADGEVVGLVGVTTDITAIRKTQGEIEQSRNTLSFVLEEMSDGVALIHHDGQIVLTNEQYRALFPRTGKFRVAGAFYADILAEVLATDEQPTAGRDDSSRWIAGVLQRLKTGGDDIVQLFDGRWLQIRIRSHMDGISIVVVSDITSLKRAEADLVSMTRQLEQLARTDALTRLVNRRGFDETVEREVARARRSGLPLSVLMIDLDRFKLFNDHYGHLAGDACLQKVATAVSSCLKRSTDVAARYGGEELAIILPETDSAGAAQVGEEIRTAVRALDLQHAASDKGIVTISLGVASLDALSGAEDVRSLLLRADEALYLAKSGGRDKCVVWQPPAASLSNVA